MDEGLQKDEQFEMEIDTKRRAHVQGAALTTAARKKMIAGGVEVIQVG